jgi:murein DD-endopeptidase MepM/ murein hydrolase activator NlpD
VEFIGRRNGYGNVVDVRHSGSYMSRYAHFSRFAANLRKGQSVDAGEVIGFVGQTGHATGPHLHFEFLRAVPRSIFSNLRFQKSSSYPAKIWRDLSGCANNKKRCCVKATARSSTGLQTVSSNRQPLPFDEFMIAGLERINFRPSHMILA